MKRIPIVLGALLSALIFSMPVSAKTDGILVQSNGAGKYSQYSYSQLVTAAEDSLLGFNSPLYEDFKANRDNIVAFHDDSNGFVNYKAILQEAEDSVVIGKTFDINEFTSNASKNLIVTPNSTVRERVEINGQVVDGDVIDDITTPDITFDLDDII